MDNINLKPLIVAMTALTAAVSGFGFAAGAYLDLFDYEDAYIRDPKISVNKYNRIKDLAYNHRKKKVRKKNLNRLAKSQIYIGWDLSNV